MKNPPVPYEVTSTFEGREYRGSYIIVSQMIKVTSSYGSKSTQIGGSLPEVTARRLLHQILLDAKRKGLLSQ